MSFSPFSFCWKIDYFQSKWRVARYKATIRDDTNNKNEEFEEYFAWGCISESNNYDLYMLMISLRREPIRGHQNCTIATIWCRIKCVLAKNSLFFSFSLLNSSGFIVNLFQFTAKANEKLNFLFQLLCFSDTAES